MISLDQLKAFTSRANQELCDALNKAMTAYEITNTQRIQYFIAQCASETLNFSFWLENMNYTTPARIAAVWPSRFYVGTPVAGKQNAADFINNPEKLGNAVYDNRMGNGPGEGYKYRGRGAGHLTGKAAYQKYSQKLFGDNRLVDTPELVEQYDTGCLTFAAFWKDNGLNDVADKGDFKEATKRINGATGSNLERVNNERLPYLTKAKSIF